MRAVELWDSDRSATVLPFARQLKNMEKMLDGIGGGFGGGSPGDVGGGAEATRDSSEMDSDVAEEDKMEL